MVTQLDACCCGCTLKTGTMIIGVVDAVFSTIILIVAITSSAALDTAGNAGDLEDVRVALYTMFVISACFSAVYLAIAIMLVIGASKDKPGLLVPWLIYVFVYAIMYVASIIVNSISYFGNGYNSYAISYIMSGVIGICFQIYFFLVVYSLYRNLKSSITAGPPSYPNFARDGNA